ncbi:MAG TPA: pyridoxamine 5'-phosphate oxidase family protein [Syntrophorhabdaceae bacterium]|nr:pyridoxamine 5'-phosphate oxidase family protein [Syntrophorhabdaceae bacterium]
MKYRIKPSEKNNEECENIIRGTYHGVLSLSRENEPYAVPMNHAYEDGRFYFHCAVGGKKIDYIKTNPFAAYTIMKYYGTPDDFRDRNNCHGKWESIIAYGKARCVEDEKELMDVFVRFMKYYGKEHYQPKESSFLETRAVVMHVERMTARRELDAKATEFYEWEEA